MQSRFHCISSILLLSCLCAFGQAFTARDQAFMGNAQASPAAAFSPSQVADLKMWYDASTIQSPTNVNGYAVTNWYDLSGNNYHAVRTTALYDAYWTNNVSILNGKPWLAFVNSKGFNNGATVLNQPNTIFGVAQFPVSLGSNYFVLWTSTNTGYINIMEINNQSNFVANAGSAIGVPCITNTWILFECVYSNTASTFWTNGVLAKNGTVGTQALNGFSIGAGGTGLYQCKGGIAEILVYNAYLASSNRVSIRAYFKSKYGLAMP